MNKKVLIISIMVTAAIGGILIKLPLVSLGIHIALLVSLLYFLIKIYKGRNDFRFYLFPCVLCQIATVGPYYYTQTFGSSNLLTYLSIIFGGIIAVSVLKSKKLLRDVPKLLLVGIFFVSMIWFDGQAMLVNVAFDPIEKTNYVGEVVDQQITGRGWNFYWVYFEYYDSASNQTVPSSVQVTKKTYQDFQKGEVIRIEVLRGLLGIRYYYLPHEEN